MGKASIRANQDDITGLIQQWTQTSGFSFPESSTKVSDQAINPTTESVQLRSKSVLYKAQWQCLPDDTGHIVNMDVKPKLFITAMLFLALFTSLWCIARLLGVLFDKLSAEDCLLFMGLVIVTGLLLWLKDSWLPSKLSRLENTFWDSIASKHDTRRLTKTTGSIHSRKSRLITELLSSAIVVYMGFTALGIPGASVLFVVCMPLFILIVADTVSRDDPQWNWRFWIIENMVRWTFLMVWILGIAVLFSFWDIIQPFELHKQEGPAPSVRHVVLHGQFRDISPATADLLEEDARRVMNEIISEGSGVARLIAKVLLFSISCAIISLFAFVPFRGLLTSQRLWKSKLGKVDELQGPFVPYLPQAWKWKTPLILQGVVMLHYVFGGIVNVAAAIFCVDGICYSFSGRTILIERGANLWSLLFVSCKMLWGNGTGQVIGTVFVFIVAMPFLMTFAAYLRRAFHSITLMARVVRSQFSGNATDSKALFVKNSVKDMCSENAVREPVVILVKKKDIGIRLYWAVLNARAVIEITDGALELLTQDELRAAIAHELGHVKQGVLKVEVLKLLSSLALFPNHYLTLCLNWSSKEMQADRFALEATNDPNSLKQALIKTSTGHVSDLNDSAGQRRPRFSNGWLGSKIRKKWLSILTSVRFFWGDSLFGYSHPYLSERIKGIDAFVMEENGV